MNHLKRIDVSNLQIAPTTSLATGTKYSDPKKQSKNITTMVPAFRLSNYGGEVSLHLQVIHK